MMSPKPRAIARRQPAHDAEVDVDDLASADDEVAGMGIGVEEPVIEDLRERSCRAATPISSKS